MPTPQCGGCAGGGELGDGGGDGGREGGGVSGGGGDGGGGQGTSEAAVPETRHGSEVPVLHVKKSVVDSQFSHPYGSDQWLLPSSKRHTSPSKSHLCSSSVFPKPQCGGWEGGGVLGDGGGGFEGGGVSGGGGDGGGGQGTSEAAVPETRHGSEVPVLHVKKSVVDSQFSHPYGSDQWLLPSSKRHTSPSKSHLCSSSVFPKSQCGGGDGGGALGGGGDGDGGCEGGGTPGGGMGHAMLLVPGALHPLLVPLVQEYSG